VAEASSSGAMQDGGHMMSPGSQSGSGSGSFKSRLASLKLKWVYEQPVTCMLLLLAGR
jgi:hypothetical protein